ncbi:MAG: MTH1187 family thiamine-binding protein [Desulfarculus sp.]|nr:MTH1187 family thiamine-binding protein [Pseudomonadota bacterium]MBV1717352.1 MTH1187 family thiamine-binding protein [Desulfarculus sp.]MBU4576647.1 MTH1187 family thiamine-binding protein [Pseudomonadota bacterium]MBU4598612.1 MTH1187 family thiamine-binding protein [Pseudomonadota bacterium]MBV1739847.1 MTH1187 family thiamine-binding protein [Desulfarculus sp.]
MAVVQFTIVPLGTGTTSLSAYVAQVHKALDESGVKHSLTPMGTVLEGPLDELLAVIRQMHELPFAAGSQRVMTLINIDDRRDKTGTIEQKLKSVHDKL